MRASVSCGGSSASGSSASSSTACSRSRSPSSPAFVGQNFLEWVETRVGLGTIDRVQTKSRLVSWLFRTLSIVSESERLDTRDSRDSRVENETRVDAARRTLVTKRARCSCSHKSFRTASCACRSPAHEHLTRTNFSPKSSIQAFGCVFLFFLSPSKTDSLRVFFSLTNAYARGSRFGRGARAQDGRVALLEAAHVEPVQVILTRPANSQTLARSANSRRLQGGARQERSLHLTRARGDARTRVMHSRTPRYAL